MLNSLPIIGWLLDLAFKISLAIPFWIIWTGYGLGAKYFGFLPKVFHAPGFWNIVGGFRHPRHSEVLLAFRRHLNVIRQGQVTTTFLA